jgi:hypothetical protein
MELPSPSHITGLTRIGSWYSMRLWHPVGSLSPQTPQILEGAQNDTSPLQTTTLTRNGQHTIMIIRTTLSFHSTGASYSAYLYSSTAIHLSRTLH